VAETGTAEVVEETTEQDTAADSGWKTILFNCECHTFDEVERQLIKATHCTLSQARRYSTEVHTKGLAVVYRGPKERCEAVAMVLAEIGLVVSVAR
jgi:ATP-dependent Clp protease adapter protein ClpS